MTLVTIVVRFIGRIEAGARADLEAWHHQRRMNVTMLVNVLRDLASVRRDTADPAQFALRTDALFTRAGGVDGIIAACDEHLAKSADDWRQFLEPHFREQRSCLFRLVEALPLAAVGPTYGIVDALIDLKATRERPWEFLKAEFDDRYLDPKWPSVLVPDEPRVYHHRALEVATFFELVDGLKGGDLYIEGAADYGAFTDAIFPVDSEPEAVAQYLKDRGLPDTANEFVGGLRQDLERGVINFELASAAIRPSSWGWTTSPSRHGPRASNRLDPRKNWRKRSRTGCPIAPSLKPCSMWMSGAASPAILGRRVA